MTGSSHSTTEGLRRGDGMSVETTPVAPTADLFRVVADILSEHPLPADASVEVALSDSTGIYGPGHLAVTVSVHRADHSFVSALLDGLGATEAGEERTSGDTRWLEWNTGGRVEVVWFPTEDQAVSA